MRPVINDKMDLTACNLDPAIREFVTCLHEAGIVAVPMRKVKSGSCVLDSDTESLISLRNCLKAISKEWFSFTVR